MVETHLPHGWINPQPGLSLGSQSQHPLHDFGKVLESQVFQGPSYDLQDGLLIPQCLRFSL